MPPSRSIPPTHQKPPRKAVIDLDTGEIDTTLRYGVYKAHQAHPYTEAWMIAPIAADAALFEKVQPGVFRVYLTLRARLEFGNWVQCPTKALAVKLGISTSVFITYLKVLEGLEVIFRLDKQKRTDVRWYRINCQYVWEGSLKDLRVAHMQIVTGKVEDYRNGVGMDVPRAFRHLLPVEVSITPSEVSSDPLQGLSE